jgi:LysM repeat protein
VQRQQQVILAVRDKLLKEDRLPQLLTQLGSLLTVYSGSIQTNLTPGQLQELIEFAAGIDRDKIYAVTFDAQSIAEYFTPDGQDAIVLKPGAVQRIRNQLYNLPLTPGVITPRAPTSNSPLPTTPSVSPVGGATSAPVITSTARTPQNAPQVHIVQQGDTLFALARRYNVTVEALQQANNLSGDTINVGQQLIIPAP